MECDCRAYSGCTDSTDNAVHGSWLAGNTVQMGAFTVVGYLLYRFSQTLPALIRWPIRLFCSLTGLSSLWGWVSRLVGTLRGIQNLCKWLSRIWRFIVALSSKLSWLHAVIKTIAGPSRDRLAETKTDQTSRTISGDHNLSDPNREPGLRLILLGPSGGGRTSLADSLSGCRAAQTGAPSPMMESTKRRTVLDGREVTVIDTPDLLGSSLGNGKRAREALRSLQLAGPGPHAFLLVIRAPGSSTGVHQDAAQAIQTTLELFGDGVTGHIIIVLTHADCLGPRQTLDQLLEVDAGGLKTVLSLCDQRAELVDNGPDCPPEVRRAMLRRLVGRAAGGALMRGHFVHQLQRREDRVREELLADMASVLARKLGRM